ncbi:DNA cytosine methyltransferase [Pseudomonas stutzeri]|nr:DNA cytosine methyltransferase [Stutzerimonas stutzeri]MCQ4231955.1 DNA cytosine methyltransferase [Stutzerimonas stutzeri]
MIDLFAGAGGLSEGLSEAGFQSLYANEVMKHGLSPARGVQQRHSAFR